jgi:hypothetical protein
MLMRPVDEGRSFNIQIDWHAYAYTPGIKKNHVRVVYVLLI